MSQSRWLQLHRHIPDTRQILAAFSITFFQLHFALAFDFSETEVTEDNGIFHIDYRLCIDKNLLHDKLSINYRRVIKKASII